MLLHELLYEIQKESDGDVSWKHCRYAPNVSLFVPMFHLLPGCQCKQTASFTATWETSEIFHVSCREALAIVSRCLLLQPRGYRRRKLKRRATRDARNMNWYELMTSWKIFSVSSLRLSPKLLLRRGVMGIWKRDQDCGSSLSKETCWTGQKTVQSWKKFISHLPSTIRQVRTMPLLRSNLTEGFLALQDRNNFDKWESLWFQSFRRFFFEMCDRLFVRSWGSYLHSTPHFTANLANVFLLWDLVPDG